MEKIKLKKQAVFDYFGSAAITARTLGINRSSVSEWGDYVPQRWAIYLSTEIPELMKKVENKKDLRTNQKKLKQAKK